MKQRILLALAMAGLLFSGYLGGIKLLSDTCAFNEQCAIFLGYPTCYYGFLMYLIIFGLLIAGRIGTIAISRALYGVAGVSLVGILFAGYFSVNEILKLFSGNISSYFLGLPTCAYGLVMYVALLFLSTIELRRVK